MVRSRPLGSVAYAVEASASRGLLVREAHPPSPPRPRLLDRVCAACRARHLSRRTEEAYVAWIRRYIVFHGICDWIRSGTLSPILEGRSLCGDLQLAQTSGSEGRRGRLETFGIRSTGLLRLQCYADPHILLPNCSSTHQRVASGRQRHGRRGVMR